MLVKHIRNVLQERKEHLATIKTMHTQRKAASLQVETMKAQVEMMLLLMRDLMNQAALANNSFILVNSYFDCVRLIKRCMGTVATHAHQKQITLEGPIFSNPLDKFYFRLLFSDE